jgi:hypothetical protein
MPDSSTLWATSPVMPVASSGTTTKDCETSCRSDTFFRSSAMKFLNPSLSKLSPFPLTHVLVLDHAVGEGGQGSRLSDTSSFGGLVRLFEEGVIILDGNEEEEVGYECLEGDRWLLCCDARCSIASMRRELRTSMRWPNSLLSCPRGN